MGGMRAPKDHDTPKPGAGAVRAKPHESAALRAAVAAGTTYRIIRPPAAADSAIRNSPIEKDPVCVFRQPNRYGPTKPATLPTPLIIPTALAAAVWPRSSAGTAQNTGR